MLTRSLLAASVALVGAGPVLAGGFGETVATPAPVAPVVIAQPAPAAVDGDWSGFYAGGSVSYGDASSGDVLPDDLLDGTGALTGLHAGYNFDFGRVVAGAELEHEWSNISLDNAATDIDRVARAKLRLGYDAGRVLPYVTAGYAHAYTSTDGGADADYDGRFVGLGAEYQLSDRFSTGVEVLRHEFDLGDDAAGDTINLEVNTISLRGTIRF